MGRANLPGAQGLTNCLRGVAWFHPFASVRHIHGKDEHRDHPDDCVVNTLYLQQQPQQDEKTDTRLGASSVHIPDVIGTHKIIRIGYVTSRVKIKTPSPGRAPPEKAFKCVVRQRLCRRWARNYAYPGSIRTPL